jgi:hypothetical protein
MLTLWHLDISFSNFSRCWDLIIQIQVPEPFPVLEIHAQLSKKDK